nr:Arc family DNA-binding protein [uncultured Clostridium sp.]
MPSNKPQFIFRTDKEIIDKLKNIAEEENRTANKQLEHIVKKYIEEYEAKHKREERKNSLGKSSGSRTG